MKKLSLRGLAACVAALMLCVPFAGLAESYSVGDVITMGTYEQDGNTENGAEPLEWVVLDVQDGRALVITAAVIDNKPFQTLEEGKKGGMTVEGWENCSLRAWLNGDFITGTFSEDEAAKVIAVETEAGITDSVFILSRDDMLAYMPEEENRYALATEYAIANGVGHSDVTGSWITRSIAKKYSVYASNTEGKVVSVAKESNSFGTRPAMWISAE